MLNNSIHNDKIFTFKNIAYGLVDSPSWVELLSTPVLSLPFVMEKNYCNITDEQPTQTCIYCFALKPLSNFKTDPQMLSGYSRMCHPCYNRKYRKPKNSFEKIVYLEGEIWKSITELNNRYRISNKGRIMSLNFGNEGYAKILTLPRSKGYERCYIQGKNRSIHRFVGMYFIPNPENKPHINHIDGVPHHNWVENLEWCTCQENRIHAFRTGLQTNRGEKHSRRKINDQIALTIKTMLRDGYRNCDIARKLGITPGIVEGIKCGRNWSHIKITENGK